MEIQKVAKIGVVDSVLEQMKRMLLTGAWKSGDRIAGENELAKQFGVSRLSVRDAIHRLIGMGVLTARHGDGTYVNEIASGVMQSRLMNALLLSNPDLAEVLGFRMMMEVGGVGLAAGRATAEEIAQLRALEAEMRAENLDVDAFAKCDLAYHNLIAVISGNNLLIRVMAMIQEVYAGAMRESVRLRGMEEGRRNHMAITDAIEAHDAALAQALMAAHIQAVIDRVASGKAEASETEQAQGRNQL